MSDKRLIIFDIDGTLVAGASSEARFARFLWQQGALGVRQLLAFAVFTLRYLPRFGRHVMQKNKAYLAGHTHGHISALAERFVAEVLREALSAPVLERLRAHQAAGDTVVLLSGTPQFIADALCEALGADDAIGAVCHTRNGVFTSAPPRRHPYGPTKIDAAEILAARVGLGLASAVAFGDSINDAYLFRAVGEPIAVEPDKRLSAAAAGAGWEVISVRASQRV
ncbi:HAD family phosphatase [Salinisphaera sp. Q1T1-3]|uniref:HAD family hydrolase n=1 Tax=Salinisphaera sp. Q1T1-3 TaxID=2321229 RepID=UPI000E744A03|nr:HAD-IB family hydrolase [Salinisphaera sp. Q1T1-3]RJS91589.1 HAD-IB family hydrolase [Salinisphaera sp. Q1T1-3]